MNTIDLKEKDSVKNLYLELKQKIRIASGLLGHAETDKDAFLEDEKSFHSIANLIEGILNSIQFEAENSYKTAIYKIAYWLNGAISKEYIFKHEAEKKQIVLAIRKGIEVLRSLLHRDLRRRQLSSEEQEIYLNYTKSVERLPDPHSSRQPPTPIDGLLKSG